MAIKTISQFDAATPASNDKILFEQNGEGKSTTLADLPVSTKTQAALDAKVNTANVLTLEEIQATTDLTGKVASAKALKDVNTYLNRGITRVLSGTISSGKTVTLGLRYNPIDTIDHLGVFTWRDNASNKGGSLILNLAYSPYTINANGHNSGSTSVSGNAESLTFTTNSDGSFEWKYTAIGNY